LLKRPLLELCGGRCCNIAYRLYLVGAGKAPENDDMDAAYKLLPSVMYLIYYADNRRRKKYWAIAIASSAFMFVFGTRGPILCILIFIIALMMYGVIKERSVAKMAALTIIIVLVVSVFSQDDIFISLSVKLSGTLERLGFSSRIFDYYLAGEAAQSRGRELLAQKAIEAISQSPVLGYGFTGDRYLLGIYVHNFILEIWLHFGIILGSILLISMFTLIIVALAKTIRSRREFTFVLMLVCMMLVKLLLSSTYTIEPYFYFMIGVCICTIRKNSRSGGRADEEKN
jgi:O-antigen ligase